ncbi:MAG: cytochrome (ubi)quinol oxidase subunit III [Rhodomicrobium sp.]
MSTTEAFARPERPFSDPYKLGRRRGEGGGDGHDHATGHGEGGPASARVITGYGFWIFLLSDIIMFSCFFAAFAVLRNSTAGGPSGADLFETWRVATETALLLASSFFCGMAAVAATARNHFWTQIFLLVTGLFGLGFVLLELQEFAGLIGRGAGPTHSAFLSSFFALVGLHGTHVSVGLLWLGTMMAQVYVKGFRTSILHRLLCFNLFWHTLDIIWVAIFTIVYLMSVAR